MVEDTLSIKDAVALFEAGLRDESYLSSKLKGCTNEQLVEFILAEVIGNTEDTGDYDDDDTF